MPFATLTSPMKTAQINAVYYVGEAFLGTIQQAVTFAVQDSNNGTVVIPQNYAGSDTIGSVSGGSASVYIVDKRSGQRQSYTWNGTNYVPETFLQLSDITQENQSAPADQKTWVQSASASELDFLCVNDAGTARNPWLKVHRTGAAASSLDISTTTNIDNGDLYVLKGGVAALGYHQPTTSAPNVSIGIASDNVSPIVNFIHSSTVAADIILWADNSLHFEMPGATTPLVVLPNQVDVNGNLICKQRIKAYGWQGGPPDLSASNANMGTGSDGVTPVFSLINSTAATDTHIWTKAVHPTSMTWSAVADNGTDNYWMTANRVGATVTLLTIVPPVTIQGNLTGNSAAFNSCTVGGSPVVTMQQIPPGSFVYPPAGIAVSTGSVWGTSIDPATLATVAQLKNYLPLTGGTLSGELGIAIPSTGNYNTAIETLSSNLTAGQEIQWGIGQSENSNNEEFIGFRYAGSGSTANALTFGFYSTPITMMMTPVGIQVYGTAQFNAAVTTSTAVTVGSGDYSNTAAVLCVGDSGYGLSSQGGALYLWSQGNTVVGVGDLHVAGGVYGSTKSFKIPHPLDATKELVHASLEGPEHGVFYRGEVMLENGAAQVVLPDYFEALTLAEDRSVLLTQISEEDGGAFAMLTTSRVVDGKFRIRSSVPNARVAWEVKAVRRDVERLEVVRDKELPPPPPPITRSTKENAA